MFCPGVPRDAPRCALRQLCKLAEPQGMSALLIVFAHGLVVVGLVGWLAAVIRRELRPPRQPQEQTTVLTKITVDELRRRHRADEMPLYPKSSAGPRRAYNRSGSAGSNHGGAG